MLTVVIVIVTGLAFLVHGLVFGPRWWRNELPTLAYRPDAVPGWWPYGGALWRGMLRTPLVGWIAVPLGCAGVPLVALGGVFVTIGEAFALVCVVVLSMMAPIVLLNRPKFLVIPWLRDQPGALAEWRGAKVPPTPPIGSGLRQDSAR